MRSLIASREVTAVHDISDGGMMVALAEMALAGNIGAAIDPPGVHSAHAWCFGEDQGRYLVTAASAVEAAAVMEAAQAADVAARIIGKTGGIGLTLAGHGAMSLADLRRAHEGWLPATCPPRRPTVSGRPPPWRWKRAKSKPSSKKRCPMPG